MRERLRSVSMSSVLLHGVARSTGVPERPGQLRSVQPIVPETQEYVDARTEAATLCRNLGLDVTNEHWDAASVGDFVRLAYAQGWKACESRLAAPDTADAIAHALNDPASIVERNPADTEHRLTVRAVQQAVAYGIPVQAQP